MSTRKKTTAGAETPTVETPAPTPVAAAAGAPTPPLARTPKPRRRPVAGATAATAAVAPPVAGAGGVLDPITTEVPWAEPATEVPAFLRDRTPRPSAPVAVRIIGEEPAAPAIAAPPLPANRYEVYLMGDAGGCVHYVGLTDNHDRRLRQHISAATHPRSLWLQRLIIGEGQKPLVQVAGTYPTLAAAQAAEAEWIERYRAEGHPLTNDLTPRERRTARSAELAPAPAEVPAPPLPRPVASPPAALPPLPRRPVVRHAVMGIAAMLTFLSLLGAGFAWLGTAQDTPSFSTPGRGSAPLDTPDAASRGGRAPQGAPTELAAAPGALENPPTPAPQRVGSHSVAVQPGQSLTDVAGLLDTTPAALSAQLGRDAVYAGEVVTVDLYAGDPAVTALSQGGGPTPTIDVHNGKGADAPLAPVIETTVLASTGLCPPGSARAGLPRDGRVVVPFEPGCAPEDAGQVGPQSQPWVPALLPPPLASGGGPPSNLPATGGGLLHASADLLGVVADTAATALEQTAPPPVTYCADGTVRDLVHRTRSPFVPGCAPLPIGPVQP